MSPKPAVAPAITTVSLTGVGGQGIILAAAILANTAMAGGFDVKASEVKGMAQRGGSVVSTVRFGKQVWSPLSPTADVVIATEALEGRRCLALLGGASTVLPFDDDAWQRGLELAVPAKILEINRRAFALGRDAAAHQEG